MRLAVSIVLGIALILVLGSESPFKLLIFPLGVVLVAGVLKIDSWLNARWERTCLLGDCELQHAAVMAGNEQLGVYGRFQP